MLLPTNEFHQPNENKMKIGNSLEVGTSNVYCVSVGEIRNIPTENQLILLSKANDLDKLTSLMKEK